MTKTRPDGTKHSDVEICAKNIEIFSVKPAEHHYKEYLRNGKTITRKVVYSTVAEYVDMSTGEIISPEMAHSLGVTEVNLRVLALKQNLILDKLRKEVRDFADFLLHFRNKRRGISPDLDTLCTWYADYKGMRKNNVTRYVATLKEVGILASDSLLMPLFQISGKKTKGVDHLSEDFEAAEKMRALLRRKRDKTA